MRLALNRAFTNITNPPGNVNPFFDFFLK
ncbi:hypothetical protein CY0110_19192 [Crocosphaera chwakensis CCY0110]|uniref:Uncharacterized protein n=1 Tax=Crocosphaera chwakensis CCY0110 TaxID=391612 RepID=A3IJH0_9CHRO|nr:hypothetical protein CY0110_19192 [Crocosphaera chwakensis CCY0110]